MFFIPTNLLRPNEFVLFWSQCSSITSKLFHIFAIYSLLIIVDSTKIDSKFSSLNADSSDFSIISQSSPNPSQFNPKSIDGIELTSNDGQKQIHSHSHQNHHHRRRHRRRLPFGAIGRFFTKLTGGSKVAAASADDVAAIGTKFAKNGDKIDDFVIGGTKMGKNVGKGPNARGFAGRRGQSRSYDGPSFNPYSMNGNEASRKARSKALTGANLALATGGVAAGIWYFSGENATLFITILIVIGLICILLAASFLAYCFLCLNKKRGYYAVNEEDIAMAFAKKLLFYMFC